MDAQELIRHIGTIGNSTGSDGIELLRTLRDQSRGTSAIASQTDLTRRTVHNIIGPLNNVGVVDKTGDGYQLNGSGAILLRAFLTVDPDHRDAVTTIADRDYLSQLLQQLAESPTTKRDLTSKPNAPSESTIRRRLRAFEQDGWLTQTRDGAYTLTPAGKNVLHSYDSLVSATRQILEKLPCLRNLDIECADLPIRSLTGERMDVATPARPQRTANTYIEFIHEFNPENVDHIRFFASYFDRRYAKAHNPFVVEGVTIDTISPNKAMDEIPTAPEAIKYVLRGFEADNTQWYIYPDDSLPMGLTIIDDDWAVFGVGEPANASRVSGTIYASDDDVVQWAIELFENYLETSRPPWNHLKQEIITAVQSGSNETTTDTQSESSAKPMETD